MKTEVSSFGEQIRFLRESAGLSLKAVAFEIGIDISLLGKIERNERPPTKEQLKLVAHFFKLDEKVLIREMLSDQIAYRIIAESLDVDTLKVAEKKVQYFKKSK